MFADASRYARVNPVDVPLKDGRTVKAVALRRLPAVDGDPLVVKSNDRLDIIAQRRYQDPTRFWHVADANTELEAPLLVGEPNRVIRVPPPS